MKPDKRSRARGMVAQSDILEFNEDSEPVQPGTRQLYPERFIEGEIYRAARRSSLSPTATRLP